MKTPSPSHGTAALLVALFALGGLAALLGACSPAHRAMPAPAAVTAQPSAAEPDREAAPPEPAVAQVVPDKSAPETTAPADAPSPAPASEPAPVAAVDFHREILPILETRCQPCHFPGGKMYDRLPFDRPETLYLLGTKLFTRIRDADEQALLREFLAQGADG